MFICSVRASTLRFIGAAVLCAVLLFGTLILSDGRLVAAAQEDDADEPDDEDEDYGEAPGDGLIINP